MLGSTTVWVKVRAGVPEPPWYPAHFSPHSAGSISIFRRGDPVTSTVLLKVTVMVITSSLA